MSGVCFDLGFILVHLRSFVCVQLLISTDLLTIQDAMINFLAGKEKSVPLYKSETPKF